MRAIVAKLNAASDAYYNGYQEMLSDHEWGNLFDRLKELEDETDVVLEDSPTHRVQKDANLKDLDTLLDKIYVKSTNLNAI